MSTAKMPSANSKARISGVIGLPDESGRRAAAARRSVDSIQSSIVHLALFAEQRVNRLAGRRLGEAVESSLLREHLSSAHESTPRCARERAADADAAHPKLRDLRHGEFARVANQEIE